jgi:hypothetical protein
MFVVFALQNIVEHVTLKAETAEAAIKRDPKDSKIPRNFSAFPAELCVATSVDEVARYTARTSHQIVSEGLQI